MSLIPIAPPMPVPLAGGFDYVTVDAAHRRVYAAHTGASTLLIVDADSGTVVHQIKVGPMHGVAYTSDGTKVYTGNGDDKTVSEIDPKTFKVLGTVALPGHKPEYLAVDPTTHAVYQNIADKAEVVIVDPEKSAVVSTFVTPE